MGGRDRIYDELFEGPLLRWSEEREAALVSGDRKRYDSFRTQEPEFLKFLKELEDIDAANDPSTKLKRLMGELAKKFSNVFVIRVGKWSAYYELDSEENWLAGLVVVDGKVSPNRLSIDLAKARERSLPEPPPKKPS